MKNDIRDIATKAETDVECLEMNISVIKEGLTNILKNFFVVGQRLSVVQDSKGFKAKNYKSFLDFSKSEFGLSKDQTYRMINIYKKFSLDDKYLNYSFSQLTEMLTLPSSKLEFVNENMTVKQIRQIKKNDNDNDNDIDFGDQVDVLDSLPVDHENEESQNQNEIPISKLPLKQQVEYWYNEVSVQSKKFCEEINRLKEENSSIQNENANLLSQLLDFQNIKKENEKFKKQNKKLERELEKLNRYVDTYVKDKGEELFAGKQETTSISIK